MWKRILAVALCVVLFSSITVYAAEPRISVSTPTLEFDGNIASCYARVVSTGDNISVTMKLWYGNTLVDSWTKSGVSAVTLNETCTVTRGRTYTLEISGTCGAESFGPTSVSKRSSPNEFAFTFHLNGLTLQSINGNYCFMDSSGEEMFSLAPLFAIDAAGELTQDVFYEILPGLGKNEVTVKVVLDNDYLSDPDRIFPIVVDPSIMMSGYSNIYDTYVTERYPTLTNGAVTYLRTGRDTDFYTRRSYIRFVLPTYIDGDNVTSAYINLKKYSGATPAITAYRVLSSWDSNTLTWNSRPNYTTVDCSATASLVSDNWYRAYVTNIVKGWLKGTTANHGFMIRDAVETNTDQWTHLPINRN